MNGMEAKAIHPETREKLPLDEEGILCFTGPTITDGYYNNTEQTQKCFVQDETGKNGLYQIPMGQYMEESGGL